ncbi:unnamed protein product [Dimorphilus gyrociliatus]|uniref:Uncharacterized protein n=1 Tax=Dimorphilus gyrociliatus TaxID=2664684 RepID=A0A7I8V7P2_9ANNE|nr:unnamed protein product [Dimorphilus gyrociliatus]
MVILLPCTIFWAMAAYSRVNSESILQNVASYKDCSIQNKKISSITAGKANFRYRKEDNSAHCDVCKAKITFWEDIVDPFAMHKSSCGYLKEYRSRITLIKLPTQNARDMIQSFSKSFGIKQKHSYKPFSDTIEESYKNFPKPHLVKKLIDANFWYTNIGDSCICVVCKLIAKDWNEEKPINIHFKKAKHCKFIQSWYSDEDCPKFNYTDTLARSFTDKEYHYVPGLSKIDLNNITVNEELVEEDTIDHEPKNRKLKSFAKRRKSLNKLRLSVEYKNELAAAGFYCDTISEQNRQYLVVCYHCKAQIRTNNEHVNPTIFHAMWHPLCAYIIRRCGLDNVRRFASLPNYLYKKDTPDNSKSQSSFSNIDPREARARMDTPIVQLIVAQGHNWNTILRAIEIFMRRSGDDFTSATELLDVVKELEEKAFSEREKKTDAIPDNPLPAIPDTPPKTEEDYRLRNDAIKQARRCKNIKSDGKRCEETSNIVSLPCGCLALCEYCADDVVYCKRCNHVIRGTVKIFRS